MKVMIVVTHLLGTGHLSRALNLARAFGKGGHDTLVLSGGFPVPHLDTSGLTFAQLPALRSDGVNFTHLLTMNGETATDGEFELRQTKALEHLAAFQPDVLITELYPFGRRILAAEFLALLEAAHNMSPRPVVLSSVRDILAPPSKPSKAAKADEVIATLYDGVLVHSDPAATELATSWPVSETLAQELRYTGYVAPPRPRAREDHIGTKEIIVSAGGGNVGARIFETAAHAARLVPELTWRILVGGAEKDVRIAQLKSLDTPAVIEAARPDFRQMLCHATASVSMCGYNTAMDVLQTGVPSVFVPFDAGNEVEQTLRDRKPCVPARPVCLKRCQSVTREAPRMCRRCYSRARARH